LILALYPIFRGVYPLSEKDILVPPSLGKGQQIHSQVGVGECALPSPQATIFSGRFTVVVVRRRREGIKI
jgi:hypothetical protein